MPILVGRIALIAFLVAVTVTFIVIISAVPAMGITILEKKIRRLPERNRKTLDQFLYPMCPRHYRVMDVSFPLAERPLGSS